MCEFSQHIAVPVYFTHLYTNTQSGELLLTIVKKLNAMKVTLTMMNDDIYNITACAVATSCCISDKPCQDTQQVRNLLTLSETQETRLGGQPTCQIWLRSRSHGSVRVVRTTSKVSGKC